MALTVTCHVVTMVNGLNGAWAALVYDGDRLYPFVGVERTDSVDQLELLAMTRIMQEDPVSTITFHSKNKTLVGSYYAMLPMWMKANWMKAGAPIPHSELWQRIVELREGREIELQFVEEEHRFFEKCTSLAREALRELEHSRQPSLTGDKEVSPMEQQSNLPLVTICTKGVCYSNGGVGGWSAILVAANGSEMPLADGECSTTSYRMDIIPVIRALEALKKKCRVRIMTESSLILNCFKHNWRTGWEGRNWNDTQGSPVPNAKLWQRLFELVDQHEVFVIPYRPYLGVDYAEKCAGLAKASVPNAA